MLHWCDVTLFEGLTKGWWSLPREWNKFIINLLVMWLDKITPKNFRENNPLIREKILEIQKIAKHPLIIIMGASGVGKDTIINKLLERNEQLSKIKRATTRERKERDQKWDFEYLTHEEMSEKTRSWDILFTYESHREDWSQYWMFYEELKKLKEQPLITVMWQGWLQITNHVPVIICMLTRNEWDIVDALSGRQLDKQTQKNIKLTKANLTRFLNVPLQSQLIIENKTGNIDKTVWEIEDALKYFEEGINSNEQDVLNSIFNSNIIDSVAREDFDLDVFRKTLLFYLRDENWKTDREKISHLVRFMYTRKFAKVEQYLGFVRSYWEIKNKKWIIGELETFYRETAKILYNKWFQEESKKILLQIGEIEEPNLDEDNFNKSEDFESKIDISDCLIALWARYIDSYIKDDEIVFYHNGYAWWRNASKLAKETLNLLLKTKDVEIERSTSMWGYFQVKLLQPYNGIKYIELQIIKDEV